MKLRDYQRDAVRAVWSYLNDHEGNPVIWAPVGAGKSIIMAQTMVDALRYVPGCRVLMLTHSAELVVQNMQKLQTIWPEAPCGMAAASRGRKEMNKRIVFGMINTIYKHGLNIGRVDLIIVDECHSIPKKKQGMWHRFIDDVKKCNPDVRIIGLTGTPWRLDSGDITTGEDSIFDAICYKIEMSTLIERGFLAPVVSCPSKIQTDTSNVRTTAGDFNVSDLGAAVEAILEDAVADFVELGKNRRTWMIFAPTVDSAAKVQKMVQTYDISCALVTADTPATKRDEILQNMRDGVIRAAVSVGTLTTGIDVPQVDMVVALRPSKSSGLVIQMIGRGMRLSPETGKIDCLLLDYAGWLSTHGPIDLIEPPRRKGKGGAAPKKACPNCRTAMPIHLMTCTVCGHELPHVEKEPEKLVASSLPALSRDIVDEANVFDVMGVRYSRNIGRDGKKDTLRMDVLLPDGSTVSKWLCPEHTDKARYAFCSFWQKFSITPCKSMRDCPTSVVDALRRIGELKSPSSVQVVQKQGTRYKQLGKIIP